MKRTYEPSSKHKRPRGFGTLCPKQMGDTPAAQDLLDRAIQVPDADQALWAAQGQWCFTAKPTRVDDQVWHGYPVIGCEVDPRVLEALVQAGQLTPQQRRRLEKQRELPESWP